VIPQSLGSHYLLVERIGQGSMGVVWQARDLVTGNLRAVKLLHPEYAADPTAVSRFVRERTALVMFRHPNVVTLHDMIVEGERLGLVMDLVTGADLATHRRQHGGRLAAGEASELAAQICDGLAAAHAAGIVHRDLKPANVLLEDGQVRLADFGIARIADGNSITASGLVMGTAAYLAPEVIKGQQPSPACDVYAVGITICELLTGEPPFTGHIAAVMHGHLESEPARPDDVPERLWELIAACLSKDPAARPSAANLAQALHNLAQLPGGNAPSPAAGPIPPPVAPSAVPPGLTPERAPYSGLRRLLRAGRTRVAVGVAVLAIAVVTTALIVDAVTGAGHAGAGRAPSASASGPGWHCGLRVPATFYYGHHTGQTIQACIRIDRGYLELSGILTGTRNAWKESIMLTLQGPGQKKQRFSSPVCTTGRCVYEISAKPASGTWAVRPAWYRNGKDYESSGSESPFVYY
jgi:hypothetical protein